MNGCKRCEDNKSIEHLCKCTPTKPTGSVEEMALQYAIAENDRRGYVKGHNGETKDAFKAGHAQATAEWKELHDNDETCINNMLREMKSLQTKLDVAIEALHDADRRLRYIYEKTISDPLGIPELNARAASCFTIANQGFKKTTEALSTINEDKKG